MLTEIKKWDRRRIARYVALATLLVMLLTTSFRRPDVVLRYEAPAGELKVSLYDSEGDRMRTVWFPKPPYEHTVTLAEGSYRAQLALTDGRTCSASFAVIDEHPVVIEWCGD